MSRAGILILARVTVTGGGFARDVKHERGIFAYLVREIGVTIRAAHPICGVFPCG